MQCIQHCLKRTQYTCIRNRHLLCAKVICYSHPRVSAPHSRVAVSHLLDSPSHRVFVSYVTAGVKW